MATIAWLDQLGLPIPNAGRYTFNNGTEVVSLDFSFTRAGDSGVWACVLGVSDPDVMVASGGQLVSRDNKEIGSRTNQITLVIVGEYICSTLINITLYIDYLLLKFTTRLYNYNNKINCSA